MKLEILNNIKIPEYQDQFQMTLSYYLNQTISKNQGRQEDLDRSAGNIDKVQRFRVHRSRLTIKRLTAETFQPLNPEPIQPEAT